MSLDFHPNYLWQTTYKGILQACSLWLISTSFLLWFDHFKRREKPKKLREEDGGRQRSRQPVERNEFSKDSFLTQVNKLLQNIPDILVVLLASCFIFHLLELNLVKDESANGTFWNADGCRMMQDDSTQSS